MKNIKDTPLEERYARRCDITGKGMNEGWVWCDGAFYVKSIDDALAECVKDKDEIIRILKMHDYEVINHIDDEQAEEFSNTCNKVIDGKELTPQELLDVAYAMDYCFWTNWYETLEEDDQWYTEDGKEMNSNN